MSATKIFCFNNGGPPGFMQAVAIGEDGRVVGSHLCSHEGFMAHDLGITSDWKHEGYDEAYGKGGWELEWVSDPDNHEGLSSAIKRNMEQEQQQ